MSRLRIEPNPRFRHEVVSKDPRVALLLRMTESCHPELAEGSK